MAHRLRFFLFSLLNPIESNLLELLAVQILVELPAEVRRGIIKPHLLVKTINLLHILRIQLEIAS